MLIDCPGCNSLWVGQSRLMKSPLIYWEQERWHSVIKVQNGDSWLPGLRVGQSRSMKPALSYCWLELRISKSYHHLMLKSPKVTAPSFIFQPWWAVDLDKTKLVWLLMELEWSLIWHCVCVLFRKIDCQKFIFHCVWALFCKIDCSFPGVGVKSKWATVHR